MDISLITAMLAAMASGGATLTMLLLRSSQSHRIDTKATADIIDHLREHNDWLRSVLTENGGTSLADSIVRIERRLALIADQLDTLTEVDR